VQYDLADVAALLLVPTLISLFVWRDGWFTLQGTGILVRRCDLPFLWQRHAVLLVIKPAASMIARAILSRHMRKTLLGKKTIHGVSKLAAELMASRKVLGSKGTLVQEDEKVHARFELVEEQLELVSRELSITNLNYKLLTYRLIKRSHIFFACVVAYQLFAALPVHVEVADGDGAMQSISGALVWMYLPGEEAYAADADLSGSFSSMPPCIEPYYGWAGGSAFGDAAQSPIAPESSRPFGNATV